MKHLFTRSTRSNSKRQSYQQNIALTHQKSNKTNKDVEIKIKRKTKPLPTTDQIQSITNYLYEQQTQFLVNHVVQSTQQDQFPIDIVFNQIFMRTYLQPQTILTIKPTKRLINNLILMAKIVKKNQATFSITKPSFRQMYLRRFLVFITYILNGVDDNINSQLKQKVLKNKNLIKNFLQIQLSAQDQESSTNFSIFTKKIYQLQLTFQQKKQLVLSLIRNFKISINIFIQLFNKNKKLITWTMIKNNNLIQNLQTILQNNKSNKIYVQALIFLVFLTQKYKNTNKSFDVSRAFNRFSITENIREQIISQRLFRQNFVFYFLNCCPIIPTKEMWQLCDHFMKLLKQVYNQKEKLVQVSTNVWFEFLLDIIEVIIVNGNKQQNILMLISNGLFEMGIKFLQIQQLYQQHEDQIYLIFWLCLRYFQKELPYFYNCYLYIVRASMNRNYKYRENLTQMRKRNRRIFYKEQREKSINQLMLE